jgi:hypothetical protein
MHPLDYARKQLLDTLSAGACETRQQLVQLLSNYADSRMGTLYKLVYPTKCTDEESMLYMSKLEPNFAVYARQLADAKVISASIETEVKFDKNKRVVASLTVHAIVRTSGFKGRLAAKSFQDYAAGVVDRLFNSFKKNHSFQINLSKKAAFQLLNKMIGNDILYEVQISIEEAVRMARTEANQKGVLEAAIESFREKHRMKYTGDLVTFLRQNIPPGLLEEEDFHRAWKEFLVEDLMNA